MSSITEDWRKSSYSNLNGSCTEARTAGGQVQVRDSKLGDASPILTFTLAEWTKFIASIKGTGGLHARSAQHWE